LSQKRAIDRRRARYRQLPAAAFVLGALAGMATVSLLGIGVEKNVNALLQRFSTRRAGAAAAG
jgi:hypothetical protein